MNHVLFAEAISEIKSDPRLSVIMTSTHASSKRKLRRIFLSITAITFFMLSVLFLTFVHMGTWINGYSVAKLEHQQDQLLRELQALKLEEAVLKRPERMRQIAVGELQLMKASQAPTLRIP